MVKSNQDFLFPKNCCKTYLVLFSLGVTTKISPVLIYLKSVNIYDYMIFEYPFQGTKLSKTLRYALAKILLKSLEPSRKRISFGSKN